MINKKLRDMVKGWFVGNFEPTAHCTDAVEVAYKEYDAGAVDARHYHKIATETTLIIFGEVSINGTTYGAGDIIVVNPNEIIEFIAITNTGLVAVKVPGVSNDKYLV